MRLHSTREFCIKGFGPCQRRLYDDDVSLGHLSAFSMHRFLSSTVHLA